MDHPTPHLLFLCTGNYYRSRFAEYYFRHLAAQAGLAWTVDSRALRITAGNLGPLSRHTLAECIRLGVATGEPRMPIALAEAELEQARLTIAVKETEHRPLMRAMFPAWEDRIEYWEIHDLDAATPEEALPELRRHVEALIERLKHES